MTMSCIAPIFSVRAKRSTALNVLADLAVTMLAVAAVALPTRTVMADDESSVADTVTDRSEIQADWWLRNATLHVGDGGAPQTGDVAIRDGRIAAIGALSNVAAKQTLDCEGLVVCPGFIDLHNHGDDPLITVGTDAAIGYLTQGCTLLVTGNCGAGHVDVAEYVALLKRRGVGVNVAHLMPHGDLRAAVMGEDRRAATPAELQAMEDLLRKGLQAGAVGMSTGLIYVPSSYADVEELSALCRVVAEFGGIYVSHIRNEGLQLLDAVDEALEIGRRGGVPVHISHFKSSGKDSWGLVRLAVEKVREARAAGMVVTADQYPYTASSTSLGAMVLPAAARSGGADATRQRLSNPERLPELKEAIASRLKVLDDGARLQIAEFEPEPTWAGRRLSEVARDRNVPSIELAIEILLRGGAAIVNHSIHEPDVQFVMQQPWVATASDGSPKLLRPTTPHPRSYGTFPRKLGHYAIREEIVSLAAAIYSATGLPADILGLTDRGRLQVGAIADVVVLDPKRLRDLATFDRPHRQSEGIEYVFLAGQPAVAEGVPTGARAGVFVRRPTRVPEAN